jgi:hypothetical protein
MADQIGLSAELLHVPNAHPAAAIIETAKFRGCDLIVMASHGRRGLRKLLLGTQTSEVLVDGSVPVLVVHEQRWSIGQSLFTNRSLIASKPRAQLTSKAIRFVPAE